MIKSERTPEQMAQIQRFKFNFDVDPPGSSPRKNWCHDLPSKQNWNSRGGGRKDTRNRGYNQGCGDDRRDNGVYRGSYNSNSNNCSSSTTRHRVVFDGSD